MIAAIERRATVSTQVRSSELPYSGYREELHGGHKNDSVSHAMYPTASGEISKLNGCIGFQRYATNGGIWAYTPEQSSATALRVLADSPYNFFEVEHFFPSSASRASVSTSLNLAEISPDLLNCLASVYALESAKRHRAASKVIFSFVERRFAASDLAAVNYLLARAELNRLSIWSISGLLRVTARAKDWLPLWPTRFSEAKKTLASRGVDIVSLFAGL